MSKIPEASVREAGMIIATANYPVQDYNPELVERALEAAAPGIRAAYMRESAEKFLEAAIISEMDREMADRIAGVFNAFADAEEERGRRVALAHGREVQG